jgi:hypothetical protein
MKVPDGRLLWALSLVDAAPGPRGGLSARERRPRRPTWALGPRHRPVASDLAAGTGSKPGPFKLVPSRALAPIGPWSLVGRCGDGPRGRAWQAGRAGRAGTPRCAGPSPGASSPRAQTEHCRSPVSGASGVRLGVAGCPSDARRACRVQPLEGPSRAESEMLHVKLRSGGAPTWWTLRRPCTMACIDLKPQ